MPRLYGAQRMVLQAIQDAQGETSAFIEDAEIAQATQVALRDMRDWFLTLDQDEYVDLALTEDGMRASVMPKGGLALACTARSRRSPPPPEPAGTQPDRRGASPGHRHQRLPPPIPKLPAVANDVREMAKLLGSTRASSPPRTCCSLADGEATQGEVLEAIKSTFSNVQPDDAVFAYMAGHGEVVGDEYYFIAHDTTVRDIATNGVPLRRSRRRSTRRPSQRAFLWLDFCHSGGIIPRDLGAGPDDREVISRALEVVQGQGKLIVAACTPGQKAYESTD